MTDAVKQPTHLLRNLNFLLTDNITSAQVSFCNSAPINPFLDTSLTASLELLFQVFFFLFFQIFYEYSQITRFRLLAF